MTDMRFIAVSILLAVTVLGLLIAQAFAFSIAWVLFPVGVLALIFGIIILGFSGWTP